MRILLILAILLVLLQFNTGFWRRRRRRRCGRRDCQLAAWNPWTTCSHPCGTQGISRRTRHIAVAPTCGGTACAATEETRACNRNCGQGKLIGNLCHCNPGWQGHCCHLDVDECVDKGRCQHICQNTIGSFECLCRPGFQKVGPSQCADIDECAQNWCEQKCTNTIGSVVCECNIPGYKLAEDLRSCNVDNECLVKHDCDQICIKKREGYECKCRSGFYIPEGDSKKCQDVDECLLKHDDCAHKCINLPGKYRCECEKGFTTMDEGRTCTDINECRIETIQCSFFCKNYQGGYNCTCPPGLMLNDDDETCSDVDECLSPNLPENCPSCKNIYGSYFCSCTTGYYMTDNGTCTKITQEVIVAEENNDATYIAIVVCLIFLVITIPVCGAVYFKRRALCRCRARYQQNGRTP